MHIDAGSGSKRRNMGPQKVQEEVKVQLKNPFYEDREY